MTPARFRDKVADHMQTTGNLNEVRAVHLVAVDLGWLTAGGMTTSAAPVWLGQYRDLVGYRTANERQMREAMDRALSCANKLKDLIRGYPER